MGQYHQIYGESLDDNKVSFKLRTGINFHKKRKDNFYIYQGVLLGMKSVQFSKFGEVVVQDELDSISSLNGVGIGVLLYALSPPTTTVEMLREGNMRQYSLQYTLGFEWFLDKRVSIQNSYHVGIKYKNFRITKGQEDIYSISTINSRYFEDFKNTSYYGVDVDMAFKINFYLF